ncbi:MAG: hypothetical protein DRP16_02885 [Candidatus Aenigmatarchaeota archaeon]|nr:MAG: hypothetical protein DRP16_02885 [Candidatus Aenigmarchaeota archaeon]
MKKDHLLHVLKSAHRKGVIDKKKYEKLKEQTVKQKEQEMLGDPVLIGEVKLIKKNGIPHISFKSGEITMPVSAFYNIIKETDDFISALAGKKIGIEMEGQKTPQIPQQKIEKKVEEVEKKEEETKLEGMKKEFGLKPKKEEVKPEIKEEVKIEEPKKEIKKPEKSAPKPKKPSFIKRILGLAKEETEEQKLLRLTMENLSKVRNIQNKREAIVSAVHVLKEFLEIKMKIAEQLTYEDLIEELKKRNIDPQLRQEMIEFFNRINIEEYAIGLDKESFENVYNTVIEFINRCIHYKFEKIKDNQ